MHFRISVFLIVISMTVCAMSASANLGGSQARTGLDQASACDAATQAASRDADMNRSMESGIHDKVQVVLNACECSPPSPGNGMWTCQVSWGLQVTRGK